ncbi:M24 family metallopeptidase [Pseudochelatococcus sp. B33]
MPTLHFPKEEFLARKKAACAQMQAQGLDGLLIFRQESMYYLTGYDTSGYSMFQTMYLGADGRCALLTRPIDRLQSMMTSIIEDVRIWRDSDTANPAIDLRHMLQDFGMAGRKLGVEYHAYGFTGQRAKAVDAALCDFCNLVDASDLVRLLRLVKSPRELEYVRKAGKICDLICETSIARCRPGVSTKAIFGDMMQVLLANGGDPSASRWPLGAGKMALLARYHTGEEIIGEKDQVFFEPAAAYRHYHACAMYNVIVGEPSVLQQDMYKACAEALDACQEALRPGRTVGETFDLHKQVMDKRGFGEAAMSACGYTLGATYPPTWMDWPMFWTGNPQVIEPGMVFFLHMILFDGTTSTSMGLGETTIVGENGGEAVNSVPRAIINMV